MFRLSGRRKQWCVGTYMLSNMAKILNFPQQESEEGGEPSNFVSSWINKIQGEDELLYLKESALVFFSGVFLSLYRILLADTDFLDSWSGNDVWCFTSLLLPHARISRDSSQGSGRAGCCRRTGSFAVVRR